MPSITGVLLMSRSRDDYLFSKYDLRLVIGSHEAKLISQIEELAEARLLEVNPEELADYFASECEIEAPRLLEENIEVSQEDIKIDVSGDRSRSIMDRSQPFLIDGTRFLYHVPFSGDAELFKCRASAFTFNPPRGVIKGAELNLIYDRTDHDVEAVKNEFNRDLAEITKHLGWVANDVAPFNARVRETALTKINQRREKFRKDHDAASDLGFPVRRRENAPKTFVVPTKRKKLPMPEARSDRGQPQEPGLDPKEYEHILEVVRNMAHVIERSPKAFREMDEEALRQHFLVQLNGQYEGQASGETFNYEGKTDILIRIKDRNIFIAECKFWNGPKSLSDAIDQILGYATWRDTKTAIVVFNRTKNFSKVLARIPEVVRRHVNYVRDIAFPSETGFLAALRHRDDPDRELTLTVLAFDVPA
ncbi:MAG: hypothetical protein HY775_05800 [Acidobacteria bacterium]|nr:hypothetical protein [Acidobacteriota bacterium]